MSLSTCAQLGLVEKRLKFVVYDKITRLSGVYFCFRPHHPQGKLPRPNGQPNNRPKPVGLSGAEVS